jgi:hypothetical protein
MGTPDSPLPRYEPPSADEPLDDVQRAIVRMFIAIIMREIREEEAAANTPQAVTRVSACAEQHR